MTEKILMVILKRVFGLFFIAGLVCVAISYFTGDGSFLSVGGVVSVLVGYFGIYIAYKLLWSVMGVYLNFAIVLAVCVFAFYFFNRFNNGNIQPVTAQNVGYENVASKNSAQVPDAGDSAQMSPEQIIAAAGVNRSSDENQVQGPQQPKQNTVELFSDEVGYEEMPPQQNVDIAQTAPTNFKDKLLSLFKLGAQTSADQPTKENLREVFNNINPFDYPSIKGYPSVVRGSVLYLNGYYFRLYGIEAPYPDQTCADKQGRSYACGTKAINWLQDWLNNREVTCYVLGEIRNSWGTAVCMVDDGKYDIGAVMTNAGWAVAYAKNTDVYVPYEKKAAKLHRGLWNGTFYKPWDWYKIKTRKIDIKIVDDGNKDSSWTNLWGIF